MYIYIYIYIYIYSIHIKTYNGISSISMRTGPAGSAGSAAPVDGCVVSSGRANPFL